MELENAGVFDELVVDEWLHVERMDRDAWWLRIGDARVWVSFEASDGKPTVTVERDVYEPVAEERVRQVVEDGTAPTLSAQELDEIQARCDQASLGPWKAMIEGRDHTSGSSFIRVGPPSARREDMEVTGATSEDVDLIAHARQDIPRLIAEVRRLRERAENR